MNLYVLRNDNMEYLSLDRSYGMWSIEQNYKKACIFYSRKDAENELKFKPKDWNLDVYIWGVQECWSNPEDYREQQAAKNSS